MARIQGVSVNEGGEDLAQTYMYTRKGMVELTGRDPEHGIEPIEVYAHAPGLLQAYGNFEYASSQLTGVDKRIRALAELKAATMTNCEYCIDIGSQIAARAGITEDQLLALPRYRDSELFGELEKLVLDYAVGMSSTPVAVSDELFAKLRARFDTPRSWS